MNGKLLLQDGTNIGGTVFGDTSKIAHGEVVFATGMTGYEQTLTDPSYKGQIVVFTFPLVGNYGVPKMELDQWGMAKDFESEKIQVAGVILANNPEDNSHYAAIQSFTQWLTEEGVCGIYGADTRQLTQKLREEGSQLGQIVPEDQKPLRQIHNPNEDNLVAVVSPTEIKVLEPENPIGITIAVIDTGIKNNILRHWLKRGLRVIRCPWDTNVADLEESFDGLFLANGPGDPEVVGQYIKPSIDYCRSQQIPIFGICLGNQMLSIAMGGKTKKMQYGHRGVNQPCQDVFTEKSVITSQNHGYVVDEASLPDEVEVWFRNLNDGTCEGIKHKSENICSVQFHPEACPGPEDTNYLFDQFIETIENSRK